MTEIRDFFKKFYNDENIDRKFNKIEILNWHHSIATRQKASYKYMKENLPVEYLFFELDYKQKITIGMSPRQISKEFYKQQQRSILGFGIYYKNNNKLECINIDIISDVLEQSGFTVVSSFR